MVSEPTFSATMTNEPEPFSVPPVTLAPALFSTGTGSPVSIEFVNRARSVYDLAVHRDLLARANPQPVADMDVLQRHLLVVAVVADEPRRLRRQVEQGADGAAGLLARPDLQHLAEEDEDDDDACGLVVDADLALGPAERVGEDAGCDGRDDAEGVSRADAEPDQRPHVRVHGLQR